MTDFNPSGPTSEQWLAFVIVAIFACLACSVVGMLAQPVIAAGVEVTQPGAEAARDGYRAVVTSDPVYGPTIDDATLGVLIALVIGVPVIAWWTLSSEHDKRIQSKLRAKARKGRQAW